MPSSIPLNNLQKIAIEIANIFSGHQYAIRGTASLVLQGYDMGVDDIDVLCDKTTAEFFKLPYSESKQFKSYFGPLNISGAKVEIYGDWQIKNSKGEWSEVFDASDDEIKIIDIDSQPIRVTKVETELKMYALMGRWPAYHKLKKQIAVP